MHPCSRQLSSQLTDNDWKSTFRGIYPPGPTTKALSPNFPLSSPFPIPPFPSFPPLVLPSIPLLPRRAPWNQQRVWGSAVSSPSGVWGEAPADIGFGVFWEGKNSFDSNYYTDVCILKFVKRLINPQIVRGAFVANVRIGIDAPDRPPTTVTDCTKESAISCKGQNPDLSTATARGYIAFAGTYRKC